MFGHQTSPLARVNLIADIPAAEQDALDALVTPIEVRAGDRLMKQGAFGNEAHLVIEGEFIVERDGEPIAMLGPGSIIGEQAVLLNEPRNATVTAATDGLIAVMSRREFASMLEVCPTLSRHVLYTAVERAAHDFN